MGLQKKISDLETSGTLTGAELFEVVQGGFSFKSALSAIKTFITTGFATLTGAETLTNKRITKRVRSAAYDATLTPDSDLYDSFVQTTITGNITIDAPTGTPTVCQEIEFVLRATGIHTIAWNVAYRDLTGLLPTGTTALKFIYVKCSYSTIATKWLVTNVRIEP